MSRQDCFFTTLMTKHRKHRGAERAALKQYFTHLDLLDATVVAPAESVRQRRFPKNSCYLSDFPIKVDSWLHCTEFGRGAAYLGTFSVKQLRFGCLESTEYELWSSSLIIYHSSNNILFLSVRTRSEQIIQMFQRFCCHFKLRWNKTKRDGVQESSDVYKRTRYKNARTPSSVLILRGEGLRKSW